MYVDILRKREKERQKVLKDRRCLVNG